MKKKFSVSYKIILNHSKDEVWKIISSPGHLNLFHPFCSSNKIICWDNKKNKKDELIYLNGLTYYREFIDWNEKNGFDLIIGTKNGKKSNVKWTLSDMNNRCEISITISPYTSKRINKFLYPFANLFLIKPKLKNYLKSVLRGLQFYMDNNKVVPRNYFGKHSWFS